MTYRKNHINCENGCQEYTAYVRIRKNWHKVGTYHAICGGFASSVKSEEEGRRLASIASSLLQYEKIKPKQRKQRDSLHRRIREMYFPPNRFKVYTL